MPSSNLNSIGLLLINVLQYNASLQTNMQLVMGLEAVTGCSKKRRRNDANRLSMHINAGTIMSVAKSVVVRTNIILTRLRRPAMMLSRFCRFFNVGL